MFSRPALLVAGCLAAGLVLWHAAPCASSTAVACAAIAIAAAIAVWRTVRTMLLPAVCVAVLVTGYAWGALALHADEWIERAVAVFADGHEHLYYITVDGDPQPQLGGTTFRAVLHAGRDSMGTQPLGDMRARVFCATHDGDTIPAMRRGDRLALFGRLRIPRGVRNPGDVDYGAYLRAQGIVADIGVHAGADIEHIGDDPPPPIVAVIERCRHAIAQALDRFVGGEEGNVLKGLLIGQRGELSSATRDAFATTGTFHVLAVSGLHVAFVALILAGVLSPILNRYLHGALLVALLLAFAVLAGGAPSIVRAVVMALLATVGALLERRLDGLNIIGGAACVLLAADPGQVLGAGFQLSFAAALGLAMFQPRLRRLTVRGVIARHRALRWTAELACASVAAQCATMPLTAMYFERLSPAGVVANLLVVPAAGIALGLAVLVAVAAPLPWFASLFGDAAHAFVHGLLWMIARMAALPFASIVMPPFSLAGLIIFYATILFVFVAGTRAALVRRAAIGIVGWCAWTLLPWSAHAILPPDALTVAVLDVGQGDGIVVRFPNGRVLVVDTGPPHTASLAPLPVTQFLLRQGISHVDALVLTHVHLDHVGGAVDLLRHMAVDTVYHGGERVADPRLRELDSTIAARGVPARRTGEGASIDLDSTVRVYVLHPDTMEVLADGATADGNLNNGSVVLKMQYGATTILFDGDLERDREAALAARYGAFLRADILKTGHHGSKTSTTEEYLAAVRPSVAIISVGENRFGHPSPSVIARLKRDGIEVDRTDQEGAVVWRSDGKTWRRVTWR